MCARTHQAPHASKDPPLRFIISAFYKFVCIGNPGELRETLRTLMRGHDMRGTVLIAPEGINGTVSGSPAATAALFDALRADDRFADLSVKQASREAHPFQRLKVKLKRAIITFPFPGADPNARVGTYVKPEDWNALISAEDVLVLDTRNAYEVAEGTFSGAVDPKTRTFTEFAAFVETQLAHEKDRKIAMFCTGGIRCEKASAYLLAQGFHQVFHLEGGILNYLEKVPPQDSLWQGDCFVFDERGGVNAGTLHLPPAKTT